MSRTGSDLYPLRWNDAAVSEILGCPKRISKLVDIVGTDDLVWLSGYVSTKAPNAPPLIWHQDWWLWDDPISFADRAPQLALLCYLSDTDAATGALRVLPGTHRSGVALHAHLRKHDGDTDSPAVADDPAFSEQLGQITLGATAGDAFLIDYRLLHGTHPNRAAQRRDCILMSFLPNPNQLAKPVRAHLAMHPALPAPQEEAAIAQCPYRRIVAQFDEMPQSLVIVRTPPASFLVAQCNDVGASVPGFE